MSKDAEPKSSSPTDRRSQLLKGVLDMCLLALIDEEPRYGYEMAQKLQERGLRSVSDGTIYPLLARLQKHGLVETFYEGSTGGPQRKYYRPSKAGKQQLHRWKREWGELRESVERTLGGEAR